MKLHNENMLSYYEVSDWFYGIENYNSAEGHAWGAKGHRIVGENLARILKQDYL